jgi:hypothetical protein
LADWRRPVSAFVAVMVHLGTTAPEESKILPEIWPTFVCGQAGDAEQESTTAMDRTYGETYVATPSLRISPSNMSNICPAAAGVKCGAAWSNSWRAEREEAEGSWGDLAAAP